MASLFSEATFAHGAYLDQNHAVCPREADDPHGFNFNDNANTQTTFARALPDDPDGYSSLLQVNLNFKRSIKRDWHADVQNAFHKLRTSFEEAHPGSSEQGARQLTSLTKSATPAPLALGEQTHARTASAAVSNTNSTDEVLFTVFTDSLFYDTRLAGILSTWGRQTSPGSFVAISDKKRQVLAGELDKHLPGTQVEETKCPPHDHWEGACCKNAEGVISAHEKMQRNSKLKWAFFSDDDVYLRPPAIASALREHGASPETPLALGIFGCATAGGCSGLCGGGGFAMNRAAVQLLAAKDPVGFLNEEMNSCRKCDGWADQALSTLWRDKGIEMRQLEGLNAWRMPQDKFMSQLKKGQTLLFHYQKTKSQMEVLHEIFTQEKLLTEAKGPCINFENHTTCAASESQNDMPYSV